MINMVLHIVYVAVVVLVLFGVSILVHELGHFLAARKFRMVIDVFSIGFGPALWKRKIGNTTYKIAWFPIGGYVALPQMEPLDENQLPVSKPPDSKKAGSAAESKDADEPPADRVLPPVSPWARMVVAVAGAAGNIVLAVILAWVVYWIGKPSTPGERCAVIGYIATNSAAYASGLRVGDEILTVNGLKVDTWSDFLQENARQQEVTLRFKTAGATNTVTLPTEKNELGFRMIPGLGEVTLCRVLMVEPDSSAERAGIQPGDRIRTLSGVKVLSIEHLISLVSAQADQAVPMQVERDGQAVTLSVTPKLDPALHRARIGIRFDTMAIDYDRVVHIPPSVQLKSHATMIIRVLRSLVTPKEAKATSQGLGGPIMILYMTAEMVRKSIMVAIWFTCFLNVNLAILNLLPIPLLDGGHVFFALIEAVTRRAVPAKIMQWLYQIFFVLLIGVIILLSGRDVLMLFKLRHMMKAAATPMVTNAVPASNGPGSAAASNAAPSATPTEAR